MSTNFRKTIDALPEDAVPCSGPLMFDTNRFITPNGRLFKAQKKGFIELALTSRGNEYFSWGNAKKLNGSVVEDMEPIEGFYVSNKGGSWVLARALVAYYFVDRISDPTGMRAQLIDRSKPMHSTNLHWVTKTQQAVETMHRARQAVNSDNIYQTIGQSEVNWDDYNRWLDSDYWIKSDGTQVLRGRHADNVRILMPRVSNPNASMQYRQVNIDTKFMRMNRLVIESKLGRRLSADEVVDHLDGNTLNDAMANLEIVDHTENVRRGGLATGFIKVDPSSMTIVERHRSIKEYCDNNDSISHREMTLHLTTGKIFNDFIWLKESDVGDLYILDGDTVKIHDVETRKKAIISSLNSLIETSQISEDMVPVIEEHIQPTEKMIELLKTLDPRGIGNAESRNAVQQKMSNHLSCCWLLSYHGTVKTPQIVLCMNTLLVFERSKDNLDLAERKCPVCVFARGESGGTNFDYDAPESMIPLYLYNHARKSKANPDPLRFVAKYNSTLELANAYTEDNTKLPAAVKAIRESVFQYSTGFFAKTTIPKRTKFREMYVSFYPPSINIMFEENPDWILQRRLNCAAVAAMRNRFGN